MLYNDKGFEQAFQMANAYWSFMEVFDGSYIGETNRYVLFETARYIMSGSYRHVRNLENKMIECVTCCTNSKVIGDLLEDYEEFVYYAKYGADIPVMGPEGLHAFEWEHGLCGIRKAEWAESEEATAEVVAELKDFDEDFELDLS